MKTEFGILFRWKWRPEDALWLSTVIDEWKRQAKWLQTIFILLLLLLIINIYIFLKENNLKFHVNRLHNMNCQALFSLEK